jgi:hypothetical protein
MTDAEWVECTDPQKMLAFLKGKATGRPPRGITWSGSPRATHCSRRSGKTAGLALSRGIH